MTPHHRSVDPEPLHHLVTLSHGDSSVNPEFHPPRRLDSLPGPAGHFPSGSSASRFASLSSLRDGREVVTVQGPLLRSVNCAPGLHEDYGPSVRHPPQVRGQVSPLPGRLAHPGLSRNRLLSVKGQTPIELEGSPLGGESSRPSSAPVRHKVVQCHLGLSMLPHSGDRVGVGPSPGGSRSAGPQVASSPPSSVLCRSGGACVLQG